MNIFKRLLRGLGLNQFKVIYLSDNPKHEDVKLNTIYIVGGKDYVKWLYLKCPDNCGENIILNLSQSKRPVWKISFDKLGRISIYPSIHKLDGCLSHFWINKGKIINVTSQSVTYFSHY